MGSLWLVSLLSWEYVPEVMQLHCRGDRVLAC